MKWPIFALIVLFVVIVNQTIFRVIDFGLFVPDLLLLITLAVVWSFNNHDFVFFGVVGGTWLEILAGLPIGSFSLGLVLIGSAAFLVLNRWLFSEKPWQYFLGAVILGTALIRVWLWFYVGLLANMEVIGVGLSIGMIWHSLFPALLANLLLIYPVFAATEFLAKYLQNFSRNKLQL